MEFKSMLVDCLCTGCTTATARQPRRSGCLIIWTFKLSLALVSWLTLLFAEAALRIAAAVEIQRLVSLSLLLVWHAPRLPTTASDGQLKLRLSPGPSSTLYRSTVVAQWLSTHKSGIVSAPLTSAFEVPRKLLRYDQSIYNFKRNSDAE